jgi:hypothetical protein
MVRDSIRTSRVKMLRAKTGVIQNPLQGVNE